MKELLSRLVEDPTWLLPFLGSCLQEGLWLFVDRPLVSSAFKAQIIDQTSHCPRALEDNLNGQKYLGNCLQTHKMMIIIMEGKMRRFKGFFGVL